MRDVYVIRIEKVGFGCRHSVRAGTDVMVVDTEWMATRYASQWATLDTVATVWRADADDDGRLLAGRSLVCTYDYGCQTWGDAIGSAVLGAVGALGRLVGRITGRFSL